MTAGALVETLMLFSTASEYLDPNHLPPTKEEYDTFTRRQFKLRTGTQITVRCDFIRYVQAGELTVSAVMPSHHQKTQVSLLSCLDCCCVELDDVQVRESDLVCILI